MAVRGIDHHQIDAGLDQRLGAPEAELAHRGGGRHPQPALLVLAGIRIGHRLLHVLDGDQPDAAVLRIDHQQLLDAELMQQPLGLVLPDALAHGDELLLGHQLGHALARIGGEAHVAVGEDADQLAGRARRRIDGGGPGRPLHHRNAGNAVFLHQGAGLGQGGLRMDGHRIDHHAGLELLDLADLGGLLLGLEVAVNDPNAAGLRHGDGHLGLGHRIHGRGDDRHIELDPAGDPGAHIGVGRHHLGQPRLEQDVVEGEGLDQIAVRYQGHRQLPSPGSGRRPVAGCGPDRCRR